MATGAVVVEVQLAEQTLEVQVFSGNIVLGGDATPGAGNDQVARAAAAAARGIAEANRGNLNRLVTTVGEVSATADANEAKLNKPTTEQAKAVDDDTNIYGWTPNKVAENVEAVVPDWAREDNPPPSERVLSSFASPSRIIKNGEAQELIIHLYSDPRVYPGATHVHTLSNSVTPSIAIVGPYNASFHTTFIRVPLTADQVNSIGSATELLFQNSLRDGAASDANVIDGDLLRIAALGAGVRTEQRVLVDQDGSSASTENKIALTPNGGRPFLTRKIPHPATPTTFDEEDYAHANYLGVLGATPDPAGQTVGQWLVNPYSEHPRIVVSRHGSNEWEDTTWAAVGLVPAGSGAYPDKARATPHVTANGQVYINTDEDKLKQVSNVVLGTGAEATEYDRRNVAMQEDVEDVQGEVDEVSERVKVLEDAGPATGGSPIPSIVTIEPPGVVDRDALQRSYLLNLNNINATLLTGVTHIRVSFNNHVVHSAAWTFRTSGANVVSFNVTATELTNITGRPSDPSVVVKTEFLDTDSTVLGDPYFTTLGVGSQYEDPPEIIPVPYITTFPRRWPSGRKTAIEIEFTLHDVDITPDNKDVTQAHVFLGGTSVKRIDWPIATAPRVLNIEFAASEADNLSTNATQGTLGPSRVQLMRPASGGGLEIAQVINFTMNVAAANLALATEKYVADQIGEIDIPNVPDAPAAIASVARYELQRPASTADNTDPVWVRAIAVVQVTQAAYDAITTKDDNTLYIIVG